MLSGFFSSYPLTVEQGERVLTTRLNVTMTLTTTSNNNLVSLKEVRKKLNLTQDEMAAILGTERARVSKIERGLYVPDWLGRAITLHRLLEKAGYTLNDLILSLPDPPENSLHTAETPSK